MRIYIATKFENQEAFKILQHRLESYGHVITHDWTQENLVDEHNVEELERCALSDACGVATADLLILLSHPRMAGAWVEVGIALALGKHVLVVDAFKPEHQRNIFHYLPQVLHLGLEDAIKTINHLDFHLNAKRYE